MIILRQYPSEVENFQSNFSVSGELSRDNDTPTSDEIMVRDVVIPSNYNSFKIQSYTKPTKLNQGIQTFTKRKYREYTIGKQKKKATINKPQTNTVPKDQQPSNAI